jgi:hypothetical protein
MARDPSGKNGNLRERIAHLAARIMAEDGVDDFAYAKRKAARQAGAPDARAMPDNAEIEQALASYRQLYQRDRHASVLATLRRQALEVMRRLARFNPHLTGSVLSGVAGKYSDIDLQLFADSSKEVEVFLLNQGVRYRPSQVRVFLNQSEAIVPVYSFDYQDTEVRVTVLDAGDIRHTIRTSASGRPIERAPMAVVETLIARQS